MKATVLHDHEGKILCAIVHDGKYDGPRPVPQDNQALGEFEVPESHRRRPLDEICRNLRADVKAGRLVERKSAR